MTTDTDDAPNREMAVIIGTRLGPLLKQLNSQDLIDCADALLAGPIAKHTAALRAENQVLEGALQESSEQIVSLTARIAELERGLRVGLEALGKVVAEEWMADKARIAELERSISSKADTREDE